MSRITDVLWGFFLYDDAPLGRLSYNKADRRISSVEAVCLLRLPTSLGLSIEQITHWSALNTVWPITRPSVDLGWDPCSR